MDLDEKYKQWASVFKKYFVLEGFGDERGHNIPLESVTFENDKAILSETGDGTINMAYYLQWLLACSKACDKDNYNEHDKRINETLDSLTRLETGAYINFMKRYGVSLLKTELPLDVVRGFFLRDDIKGIDAEAFNTKFITSSYTKGIELTNEDPCHSTYVSQDQVWNLLPILKALDFSGFTEANDFACRTLRFIIENKHVIYNPYFSTLYHFWTYVPELNGDKLAPWKRIEDRASKLKYKIKVKRGANNWYFAYGFRKAYESFSIHDLPKLKNVLYSLWYKPFIFFADRIYYPLLGNVVKRKETSYYSLAMTSDVWYLGNPHKRFIKRFNKSLKDWDKDNEKELFLPQLAFLSKEYEKIDYNLLNKWLERYPEPVLDGRIESPIVFMILYKWMEAINKY